jgi:hypothetical protein
MGTWPWVAKEHVALGEDRPAVYVSWRDAQDFVRRVVFQLCGQCAVGFEDSQ